MLKENESKKVALVESWWECTATLPRYPTISSSIINVRLTQKLPAGCRTENVTTICLPIDLLWSTKARVSPGGGDTLYALKLKHSVYIIWVCMYKARHVRQAWCKISNVKYCVKCINCKGCQNVCSFESETVK